MNGHSKLDYHLTAMAKMTEFLARHENPSQTTSIIFEEDAKRGLAESKNVVNHCTKLCCSVEDKEFLSVVIVMMKLTGQKPKNKETREIL